MTLTAEQSSNKARYEAAPTAKIIDIIRTAMGEGCIRPSHVYDAVDELICRIHALENSPKRRGNMVDAITNGKAQTNDMLRKALQEIYNLTNSLNEDCAVDPVDIRDIAKAALAEPVKNCEVGTAEEQQARHCAWCRKHGIDGDNTVNCIHPDIYCDLCALRWSQMPYIEQEGGNDGSK